MYVCMYRCTIKERRTAEAGVWASTRSICPQFRKGPIVNKTLHNRLILDLYKTIIRSHFIKSKPSIYNAEGDLKNVTSQGILLCTCLHSIQQVLASCATLKLCRTLLLPTIFFVSLGQNLRWPFMGNLNAPTLSSGTRKHTSTS